MSESFVIDKVDYYFEKALEVYCELKSAKQEELTEKELQEVCLYAGNHIGFFVAWIIKNDFIGEEHFGNEDIKKVKNETMTGTEYLMKNCDAKFWSDDVVESIHPFIKEYYLDNYYQDYCDWVINELYDLPMEFIGTWEDYHEFEYILDNAYKNFCK